MERLFKNFKTTFLGLIILAVAIFALCTGRITGDVFTAILPTVLMLFRVKDTFINLEK